MARFVLTSAAKADLRQISAYIARDSHRYARKVVHDLRDAMRQLAETPGLGHRRDDLTEEDVRFFTVYSYHVVYRPDARPLEVVAVISAAREVAAELAGRRRMG